MSDPTNNPTPEAKLASGLQAVDLGRIAYADALALQNKTHADVLAGDAPPTVFLLEHDPVITRTQRAAAGPHLIASPDTLADDGIALADTNRGGDITYHGPGQLVVYPIVPLQQYNLNVRRYVGALEQIIIDTLAAFDIKGHRDEAGVGVWVEAGPRAKGKGQTEYSSPGPSAPGPRPYPAKIAALGVRVRRWTTLHGFALNVTTDLTHFRHIIPCGLERPVTSMQQQLGQKCPPMQDVKKAVVHNIQRTFV